MSDLPGYRNGFGKIIFLDGQHFRLRIEGQRGIVDEMRLYAQTNFTCVLISESGADPQGRKGKWSELRKGMEVSFTYLASTSIGDPIPGSNRDAGVCLDLRYFLGVE